MARPRRVGYAEGYYGQLLSWNERHRLLERLASHQFNVWLYAPKDDPYHRLFWREPWPDDWCSEFATFCRRARGLGVDVVAGLAPGLDFDFRHLPLSAQPGVAAAGNVASGYRPSTPAGTTTPVAATSSQDLSILIDKARQLLALGATDIALLMDDIDDDFELRRGAFDSEGLAHATLANQLGAAIERSLLVVPRIYANELVESAPDYLPDLAACLDTRHTIVHCGNDVVTLEVEERHCRRYLGDTAHAIMVWDNLYANDYCPRRLFVGPWTGRATLGSVLLNPTGLVETDSLLLDLMADGLADATTESSARLIDPAPLGYPATWWHCLQRHGVPPEFCALADWCWHPTTNARHEKNSGGRTVEPVLDSVREAAFSTLLWRWKSPLAREWYPILMGLQQDMTIQCEAMPALRIDKSQTPPLARHLQSKMRRGN